jgi:lipopolysaccharide transport system permease protein
MVQKPTKVISSSSTSVSDYFKDLFRYKDLLITLTLRDFKVRYAQTFLGFLWAFIQPFSTILVLVFVFEKALHVDTEEIPYPLFAMSGMVLWTYFAYVFGQSGSSIVTSQSIISKVYFPRLIIPISKALVGLIDFAISAAMLCILFWYYHFPLTLQLFYVPLFVLLAFVASIGAGILFSSLTIKYRDFQYVIPFLLQFGLYVCPVAYPVAVVTGKLKWLYFLNPMAGIIEGLRWSLFGKPYFDPYCYISFLMACLILVVGVLLFVKTESIMADVV